MELDMAVFCSTCEGTEQGSGQWTPAVVREPGSVDQCLLSSGSRVRIENRKLGWFGYNITGRSQVFYLVLVFLGGPEV